MSSPAAAAVGFALPVKFQACLAVLQLERGRNAPLSLASSFKSGTNPNPLTEYR